MEDVPARTSAAAVASEFHSEPRHESREPRHESRESRYESRSRHESPRESRSDYGPPAGYQPIILPGESISKYRNLAPVAETKAAAEMEAEHAPHGTGRRLRAHRGQRVAARKSHRKSRKKPRISIRALTSPKPKPPKR